MSGFAHTWNDARAIQKPARRTAEAGMRVALIDYATLAGVLFLVSSGPALVWLLLWVAAVTAS